MEKPENQIIRYFLDELTPAEQNILMEQLVQDEGQMALFKEYERVFDKSSQFRHKADADFAYKKMASRLDGKTPEFRPRKWLINHGTGAGLAVVFILFLSAGIFFGLKNNVQKQHQPVIHSLVSENGQKAVIMLADGSKVTLNSGSKITYPEQFTGKIRMVKLEGEAFFEVTKNKKKPFCILSGNLLTHVLGTSFNIKNFKGDASVYITVASGHVTVDEFDGKAYKPISDLLPNQQLSYNIKNHSARIFAANSRDVSAWKENRLIFNNTPFCDIAASLQRLYGVQVVYPEKTWAKTAFSARFNRNTSLAEVMRVLSSTGQITYTIKDSVLYIKKNKK